MSQPSATIKVISFKIPVKEYNQILKLSKKSGVKMGPIVRGLVRQSLSKSNGTNEELIAMIRLGSILSG